MPQPSADVAILMPKLSANHERFSTRYAGLARELGELSISHFFADSHASYQPDMDAFQDVFNVTRTSFVPYGNSAVVRDMTMALDDKPIYGSARRLVHEPGLNRFLADKANLATILPQSHPITRITTASAITEAFDDIPGERVVIKPATGMASKGLHVGTKQSLAASDYPEGKYLIQEYIDTSRGIPSLSVEGMHNLRVVSIGSTAIGAIVREGGDRADVLANDRYGVYIGTNELPESMHTIVDTVHSVLGSQAGDGQNVIAIDLMRGINAEGDMVDVLCEVNRRPMRISNYDLQLNDGSNHTAIRTIASQWDKAEAAMLAGIIR